MAPFESIYNQSFALLTDLYQLTMVYGYWKSKMASKQAVFHLNFRKWPFEGGYAICAGLEVASQFIEHFRFSESDLHYLRGLKNSENEPLFEEEFLHFLSEFEFCCDIDAILEGTVVFPYEPILRIKGPIWQAQLLESAILNIVNFQTLIATKASRVCLAAFPDPVVEFGMRRAQGFDGAISASRAAYIGGSSATSNVIAGKLFDIPVRGTHAHSWIMAFDKEIDAFTAFAKVMPKDCIMLIDTYDSIEGAKQAIQVAKKIEGFELKGVRLDSGDLAYLSIEIRKLLDSEGFTKTEIMASNELDEYLIRDLKQQGAKISIWGVGTNLVTGKKQSALDGVYKLTLVEGKEGNWIHKLKISEQTAKTTTPGFLQVRRFFNQHTYLGDGIYDELTGIEENSTHIEIRDPNHVLTGKGSYKDLLVPIFKKGKCVYSFPPLKEVREHAFEELNRLPPSMKRFVNPELYFVGLEKKLYEKKIQMIQTLSRKPSNESIDPCRYAK